MSGDVPVSPDMGTVAAPRFSRAEVEAIYARIELIDAHFAACCAFQKDSCHFGGEYNGLYGRIHSAGLADWRTPIDREPFDAWLDDNYPAIPALPEATP